MKKAICILFMLNVCATLGVSAQLKSVFGAIEVSSAAINSNTYYYGEPINLYFEFSNTAEEIRKYHKPGTGVNLIVSLTNKSTGKTIAPTFGFWSAGAHTRMRMQREAPPVHLAYQPREYGHYVVQVNEQFGTESVTTQKVSENHDLAYRLATLPVGEYELELKYYPFPAKQEMTVTFPFRVIALPPAEKEAYKKYVRATVYAANAHFWAGKNYAASHQDSYENLIKEHPHSLFAQYAFLDMVREIYYYPGPGESARVARFKAYLNFYPKIGKSNLKMDYLRFLPELASRIPGMNFKNYLDKVLYSLKDEHPAYSRGLIRTAEVENKIKGLKNYTGEKS